MKHVFVKWLHLWKLAWSKNYILLTDREGIINLRKAQAKPSMNHEMMLHSQRAELQDFSMHLTQLIADFDSKLVNFHNNERR